jgi:GAF domain-containing protein
MALDTDRVREYLLGFDSAEERVGALGSGLSELCAEVVGVHGASITLMVDNDHRGCLGASDSAMATVEDLQFTLGEGPCIDACRTGRMVAEPDLARLHRRRWPAFSPPAVAVGVAAVFALPLLARGVCLGALDLYNRVPGPLDEGQLIEAEAVAEVVSHVVLAVQADVAPGSLAEAFEAALDVRAVAHQAAGMIAVQLDVPLTEGLVRLRAHAYGCERPVNDIARDVVGRTLRFDGLDGATRRAGLPAHRPGR